MAASGAIAPRAPAEVVRCKGCDKQIPAEIPKCGLCGEPNPQAASRGRKKLVASDRCAFELRGVRCPLPGTSSASRTAGGPQFCAHHPPGADRGDGAFDQLLEMQQNPGAWLPPRKETDADIERIITENPQFQRGPDESASQYRARMSAMRKAMLPQVLRRQHAPGGVPVEAPPRAKPVAPAPLTADQREERVEDAMDHVRELTAKLEDEGMQTELAMAMAFEQVLREVLGKVGA